MNSDLFTLLVNLHDLERNLVYIIKNSVYNEKAAHVAVDHIKDMSVAVMAARRVLDEVLREQYQCV